MEQEEQETTELETEEQLEIHPQNELINIFLKTFYKERYIEWFIKNTQQSKNDIILEIIS